ncbi:MAG: helix-turn-helix domain-containing protein [Chloroflexi bacterium]|nr:helix-turn-helix domain-containing protein [Chloroflexota bacterium]
MLQFGQYLRDARLACGLTQTDLAKRLVVSKGYISRLEGGKARPARSTVLRMAEVCGTDPSPLLILAGHLPGDVREILTQHPTEATAVLRETFRHDGYEEEEPTGLPAAVAEPRAVYQPVEATYELVHEDCFEWMECRQPNSIHAIVTDPPYGLKEYTAKEKTKLRRGRGGVWRIPPAIGGCVRRPLPRFTVLTNDEKQQLMEFFRKWGACAFRVLVPGGHVFIATNPLLSQLVYMTLIESGFEKRGEIIRLVQTLRGGDRPKNAHDEFKDVTVMPRSCWEPWGLFRKPCEGRVQDNLRKWKTGGLHRLSADQPFCDVIRSSPTRSVERDIAPHPSLKPQGFMRQIVRAALPLGEGVVLDPFMGGGSTIAAACAVGYASIGIESDPQFFAMARAAIPPLAALVPNGEPKHRAPCTLRNATMTQASLFG